MASQTHRGVPLSALCPKFLHTNSTSHTWPFSAIAELIDNAYDPDVNAKQFWIDKTLLKGQDCLIFMDNGTGLCYEKMHKMLSFGYSEKIVINGQHPIGLYGNGFKSGSMRLGEDAIVFSKSQDGDNLHVGMLSQNYLKKIKAEQIIVPIVSFQRAGRHVGLLCCPICVCVWSLTPRALRVNEKHKESLRDILQYSLFTTERELLEELKAINSTCSSGSSGTRIIVWSLRRPLTGQTEFDFTTSNYDIRIPMDGLDGPVDPFRRPELLAKPESYYSLRAYCSILYLKPRMQIIIRGQKVKTELISKSLAFIAKDHYKPNFLNRRVPITFGYNTKSKDQYGIMMYHKNRLIKAYERVGVQLKGNNQGVGVIGVIECSFLEPTHNKQDFDNTDKYRKTINNLGLKLEEYWKEIRFKRDKEDPNSTIPVEDTIKWPDQNWVQCDNCLHWRKLPDGIDCSLLPDKWFCHMNPDPQFRNCNVDEEPEDSDDDQPYQKTYKQHERFTKQQQERRRQQYVDDQKMTEHKRIAALAQQNEALRREQEVLKQQLKKTVPNFRAAAQASPVPVSPPVRVNVKTPLGSRTTTASPLAGRPRSSPLRPAGTGTSNTMPIISSVCSLSSPPAPLTSTALSTPSRMKRTLGTTSEREIKRQRVNGFHRNTSSTTTSSAVIIPDDDDDDDDDITDDDDIVILETSSTPIPKKPTFDLAKVKSESPAVKTLTGNGHVKTNGIETPSMKTGATVTTSSSSLPFSKQVNITTQTEARNEVKDEEAEERKKKEKEERERKTTDRDTASAGPPSAGPPSAGPPSAGPPSAGPSSPGPSTSGPSTAGPSDHPTINLSDAQEQQDKLMELLQSTAHERDQSKEQVQKLTCQVQDLEVKMKEFSQGGVKRVLCHQACQTREMERGEQSEGPEVSNPLAVPVNTLLQDLSSANSERETLRAQVQTMEDERGNLWSRCETLQRDVVALRKEKQEWEKEKREREEQDKEKQEKEKQEKEMQEKDKQEKEEREREKHERLRELRKSIGRLLVTFVPALNLEHVDYDGLYIDEILGQVLTDVESMGPA
ncbi:hypothetical protein DPEC_G00050290 [Dallia pectoralis]|uniref:Uncharacterized protein n=1 Tax=Dallia pectoralis TaxID=75939 RepID=A0ACC2HAX8_DALPE|nr:hypothetical protein DPEC_G00050290 [Dallia pectoralis]